MPKQSRDLEQRIAQYLTKFESWNMRERPDQANVELLSYLIAEELAGRGKNIQDRDIAQKLLGKGKDFDPLRDNSVHNAIITLNQNVQSFNKRLKKEDFFLKIDKLNYRVEFWQGQDEGAMRIFGEAPRRNVVDDDGHIDNAEAADSEILQTQNSHSGALGFGENRQAIKSSLLKIFTLFIILTVGFLSIGYFFGNKYAVQIVNKFYQAPVCQSERPILLVQNNAETPWQQEFIDSFAKNLKAYRLVAMSDNSASCIEVPIYQMDVVFEDHDDFGKANIAIKDMDGSNILWEKHIDIFDTGDEGDIGLSTGALAYELGHPKGVIPVSALRNYWLSNDYKQKYICLLQVHYYFASFEYGNYDRLVMCMKRYSASEKKYADIPALYAALLQQKYLVKSEQQYEQNLELAEKQLKNAEKIDPLDMEFMISYLRNNIQFHFIGKERIKYYSDKMISTYPYSPNINFQVAYAQGLYLGQWVDPDRLESKIRAIIGNDPMFALYFINANIAQKNWEGAQQYFEDIDSNTIIPYNVLLIVIYANLDDRVEVRKLIAKAKLFGYHSPEALKDEIRALEYNQSYTRILFEGIDKAYAMM